jgi:hypothetical protein
MPGEYDTIVEFKL